MIKSFKCRHTEALFAGDPVLRWSHFQRIAERKLQMLHRATKVDDLRAPPANRLELLKGDFAGQYSIRINGQWRLCFRFEEGHAFDVEIVDYH